jgi:uncharacterized protein (TIGR00369 family)
VLQFTLDELQAQLEYSIGLAEEAGMRIDTGIHGASQTIIEELEEHRLLVRRRADTMSMRPGGSWSGSAQMSLVDSVGFLMTIAHLPPGSDAMTTDLAMQFLRPPPSGDLLTEVRVLRMGRRTSVLDVDILSEGLSGGPVTHATVSFALRPASDAGDGASSPSPSQPANE